MISATPWNRRLASSTVSLAGQDQRRHLGAGEELRIVLEVRGVRDDGDGRNLGLAAALAILALRRRHLRAGVVLDAHGRCADEDDVGFLAHEVEQSAIAWARESAGRAIVGGAAVEAGDHVGPHPAPAVDHLGIGIELGEPGIVVGVEGVAGRP